MNRDIQSVAGQSDPALPGGFIALAQGFMRWAEAEEYCARLGGRLPRINGGASWDGRGSAVSIDGFHADGAPWPVGLPGDMYWTGTSVAGNPEKAWFVSNAGGSVYVFNAPKGAPLRVACVP